MLPNPSGNATVPVPVPVFVTGAKYAFVIWSTNAMYNGAFELTGTKNFVGSHVKVRIVPAATGGWRFSGGGGVVRVSLGRRMMGRGCGQETMNICARL